MSKPKPKPKPKHDPNPHAGSALVGADVTTSLWSRDGIPQYNTFRVTRYDPVTHKYDLAFGKMTMYRVDLRTHSFHTGTGNVVSYYSIPHPAFRVVRDCTAYILAEIHRALNAGLWRVCFGPTPDPGLGDLWFVTDDLDTIASITAAVSNVSNGRVYEACFFNIANLVRVPAAMASLRLRDVLVEECPRFEWFDGRDATVMLERLTVSGRPDFGIDTDQLLECPSLCSVCLLDARIGRVALVAHPDWNTLPHAGGVQFVSVCAP